MSLPTAEPPDGKLDLLTSHTTSCSVPNDSEQISHAALWSKLSDQNLVEKALDPEGPQEYD